jgi:universal stress protein E
MPTFRRLLVHLDSTAAAQPAFQRALRLAQQSRVSLRLVDVLPPIPSAHGGPPPFVTLIREKMRDRLAEATVEARRSGATATSALLDGDEATALIREAVSFRADVLLRSHAVHQKAAHPAGPVDSQLLRRCPAPVWLVTPRQAAGERVVVAAVDPDPDDQARHELSVRVAKTAMQIATAEGAALHIVHAWTAFGHQVLAGRASRKDLLAYYAACRTQAETRFDVLRRDAGLPPTVKMHLLEGHSDMVLTAFVDAQRASIVVLGTIARTGLAGLVIGNTAERVLRQVRCSVLALKPAGFAAATPEGRRP